MAVLTLLAVPLPAREETHTQLEPEQTTAFVQSSTPIAILASEREEAHSQVSPDQTTTILRIDNQHAEHLLLILSKDSKIPQLISLIHVAVRDSKWQ